MVYQVQMPTWDCQPELFSMFPDFMIGHDFYKHRFDSTIKPEGWSVGSVGSVAVLSSLARKVARHPQSLGQVGPGGGIGDGRSDLIWAHSIYNIHILDTQTQSDTVRHKDSMTIREVFHPTSTWHFGQARCTVARPSRIVLRLVWKTGAEKRQGEFCQKSKWSTAGKGKVAEKSLFKSPQWSWLRRFCHPWLSSTPRGLQHWMVRERSGSRSFRFSFIRVHPFNFQPFLEQYEVVLNEIDGINWI